MSSRDASRALDKPWIESSGTVKFVAMKAEVWNGRLNHGVLKWIVQQEIPLHSLGKEPIMSVKCRLLNLLQTNLWVDPRRDHKLINVNTAQILDTTSSIQSHRKVWAWEKQSLNSRDNLVLQVCVGEIHITTDNQKGCWKQTHQMPRRYTIFYFINGYSYLHLCPLID